MLSPNEIEDIRRVVLAEMADVQDATQHHGSYTHLCAVNGDLVYAHHPVGRVLAEFPKLNELE